MLENVSKIDDHGNEVLVGLTHEETKEFLRLEQVIADSFAPLSSAEWKRRDELRWLELFHKHSNALSPFLAIGRSEH